MRRDEALNTRKITFNINWAESHNRDFDPLGCEGVREQFADYLHTYDATG